MRKTYNIPLILFSITILFSQEDKLTETYSFDVTDITRLDATLDIGIGTLIIRHNTVPDELGGSVTYYPKYTEPDVNFRILGTKGKLKIDIDSEISGGGNDFSFNWNEWKDLKMKGDYNHTTKFQFPENLPTDLDLDFGLGDATIDLSNLTISDLQLECGLSNVKLKMSTNNPIYCRQFSVETGLGNFEAENLGNLRPKYLNIQVGLGTAKVDLTGAIDDDIKGEIDVGFGTLDLILPKNSNISLEINRSFLSSIDINQLTKMDDTWISPNWDKGLPTIELEVNVGLGSVDVRVER